MPVMTPLSIDLKRKEVDEALAELERLILAAEEAYEQAVALEEWEDEEGRDS